jgi:hypothetical protein
MKLIEKHSLRLIALFFVVVLGVLFLLFQQEDASVATMMGAPLSMLIDGLRDLSLHSALGNVLAWILYVAIACSPILIGGITYRKQKHKRSIWLLTGLFSAFLLYVIYGLLNHWFIQQPFLKYIPFYQEVIYFSISMLIGLFILAIWFYHMMQNVEHKQVLFKQFQIVLFVSALLYSIPIGIIMVDGVTTLNHEAGEPFQQAVMVASLLVRILPQVLMVILISKLINLSSLFKLQRYNQSLLDTMYHLSSFAKMMVYLSLFTTLALGVFQLIFINQIQHIVFEVTIPWVEIIVAFVLLIITRIMIKTIAVQQENEQFI